MSTLCKRCNVGIDDDFDGDCAVCASWTDEEAARVKRLRNKAVNQA